MTAQSRMLPSAEAIRQDYFTYPGQALVAAACIVQTYRKVEDAAERTRHGFCEAEGNSAIPGAGGVATNAVSALMGYRRHGDIDQVIHDLHDDWDRLTGPGTGNYEEVHEEGQRRAVELERRLRVDLTQWYKTRHRHMWRVTKWRAPGHTKGASGRGRTMAWKRECPCGAVQWRRFDEEKRRSKWHNEGDL